MTSGFFISRLKILKKSSMPIISVDCQFLAVDF